MDGQRRKAATCEYGKEVALLSLNNGPTILGTWALAITELRIKPKEKTLFAALGAAFHPLALRH